MVNENSDFETAPIGTAKRGRSLRTGFATWPRGQQVRWAERRNEKESRREDFDARLRSEVRSRERQRFDAVAQR